MSKHWRSLLLLLSAATILFAACKKKSSTDNALPVNYNPSVIIGSNNCVVYAIDPVTGKRNWEYGLPGAPVAKIYASPLVYGNCVYVGCTVDDPFSNPADALYKLDAKTGKLIKKFVFDPTHTTTIYATPVADNGIIYVAGTNGTMYALDTATGDAKWTFNTVDYGDGSPIKSSPVVYNGKLYFSTEGGFVFCLDKTMGGMLNTVPFTVTAPIWSLPLDGASFWSSPAISAPYLYVGSRSDSAMYCIYLDEIGTPDQVGDLRWRYQAHNQIESSPTIYKGRCIFGCYDFNVYCLDTNINPPLTITPTPIWITHTNGRIISSPYATNQVVYVGSDDAFLYALNILNGGIKWQFQTNGPIVSSPLANAGTIYVGSADKNFYAVDSARGTLRWYYNTNGIIETSPALDNLTGAQVNSQLSGYTN